MNWTHRNYTQLCRWARLALNFTWSAQALPCIKTTHLSWLSKQPKQLSEGKFSLQHFYPLATGMLSRELLVCIGNLCYDLTISPLQRQSPRICEAWTFLGWWGRGGSLSEKEYKVASKKLPPRHWKGHVQENEWAWSFSLVSLLAKPLKLDRCQLWEPINSGCTILQSWGPVTGSS